jgi:hypothetical protein
VIDASTTGRSSARTTMAERPIEPLSNSRSRDVTTLGEGHHSAMAADRKVSTRLQGDSEGRGDTKTLGAEREEPDALTAGSPVSAAIARFIRQKAVKIGGAEGHGPSPATTSALLAAIRGSSDE